MALLWAHPNLSVTSGAISRYSYGLVRTVQYHNARLTARAGGRPGGGRACARPPARLQGPGFGEQIWLTISATRSHAAACALPLLSPRTRRRETARHGPPYMVRGAPEPAAARLSQLQGQLRRDDDARRRCGTAAPMRSRRHGGGSYLGALCAERVAGSLLGHPSQPTQPCIIRCRYCGCCCW